MNEQAKHTPEPCDPPVLPSMQISLGDMAGLTGHRVSYCLVCGRCSHCHADPFPCRLNANPDNPVAAAEALPDLLAACEPIAHALHTYFDGEWDRGAEALEALENVLPALSAAIAKAKRERP
ncbi:MAG TPA: hypothetical protein VNA25_17195 [Phycisphaerae bacterium]|nr:hypothetical protein [Phycisphaerae bacterium]